MDVPKVPVAWMETLCHRKPVETIMRMYSMAAASSSGDRHFCSSIPPGHTLPLDLLVLGDQGTDVHAAAADVGAPGPAPEQPPRAQNLHHLRAATADGGDQNTANSIC